MQKQVKGRGGMDLFAGFELKGIEISPEAIQLAGELARRVHEDDGAALIVDYGKDGPYAESLVAIREHKRVPLLEEPGLADLSAHVDFDALRCAFFPLQPRRMLTHYCDGARVKDREATTHYPVRTEWSIQPLLLQQRRRTMILTQQDLSDPAYNEGVNWSALLYVLTSLLDFKLCGSTKTCQGVC